QSEYGSTTLDRAGGASAMHRSSRSPPRDYYHRRSHQVPSREGCAVAALGEPSGPRMVMASATWAPHRLAPSPDLRPSVYGSLPARFDAAQEEPGGWEERGRN